MIWPGGLYAKMFHVKHRAPARARIIVLYAKMFHVKHRVGKSGIMRFCKTTLWIKKSGRGFKGLAITTFGRFAAV